MMYAVPSALAVSWPLVLPMLTSVGSELDHLPPGTVLCRSYCEPRHCFIVPVIGSGVWNTCTLVVTKQPVGIVYVMMAMPALSLVTSPVASTSATPGLLVLQVPPGIASLSNDVDGDSKVAEHNCVSPVIGSGTGFTVILLVTVQPPPKVKMMVAPPADTPVTTPVVLPTLAMPGVVLSHVLVPAASVRVMLLPTHTWVGPAMAGGIGLTVTVFVARQLCESVKMISVVPLLMPWARPVIRSMVATPVTLLLQRPGPLASVYTLVPPIQINGLPTIAAGAGFTVISVLVAQPAAVV